MKLNELPIGVPALITAVGGEGALRQHFLDMGVIPGASVVPIQLAPLGDPLEIRLHGYELTLRLSDAAQISVEMQTQAEEQEEDLQYVPLPHPGLGESGKFHKEGDGNPLPDDEILTYALVGNQNCGKTTLFNALTGANQHVGNFPGVTVDRKDGVIKGHAKTLVTDLPGIYSMSPYTSEEIVSRNFVLQEKPHAIINIVDATNIERNLYLTLQLLEMGRPMVVALNMMDELSGNGGAVRINELETLLGVPVVPISAMKNEGVGELVEHALHIAHYQETPLHIDFCGADENGGAVHRCLHAICHLIEDHAAAAGIPVRFAAGKVVEGDALLLAQLKLDTNEQEALEHIICQMEHERGLDRHAAMADMRFAFIQRVCRQAVVKPHASKEHERSREIDKILTGKYTALPAFMAIMATVFFLTFNVIGDTLQGWLEDGIDAVTELADGALAAAGVNEALHGLIIDGIFAGVGSVLSFLPIIVTLFFFLSLLEDSGYIARVAFVMDRLLRKIGLSGRSIVSLLIGFGCTVPAVMSTRTLPSERDRRMTILLTPFMSCTAKLPVYAFFIVAFFADYEALLLPGLYLLGVATLIPAALLYKKCFFRGEAVPFVMELPNYRLPSAGNVARLLWEKARDFLERAFTVILVATIVIWFLQHFDLQFNLLDEEQTAQSLLACVGGLLSPLLAPLGLGDWRIATALVSGFIAKESVVATLEILFGSGGPESVLTTLPALSLLVFSLLYTPCVAAIAAVRRELGGKWAAAVVLLQCAIAWVMAYLTHLAGLACGLG